MLLANARISYRRTGFAFEPRMLTVGLGEEPGLVPVDGGTALVISHKGGNSAYRTGAEYVLSQPDDEIVRWREALHLARDAARPFAGTHIVADDASPDTCLALLALARRLAGQRLPPAFVDYAARWEAGDVRSTGEPERSWGALHSALVHTHFDRDQGQIDLAGALDHGIGYLEALLAAGIDPAAVPEAFVHPLHRIARARLLAERQSYRRIRDAAPKLQFSVPLAGARRRRLVDGIILIETNPTGALKAWLRTDRETFTGDGFALMAVYRPDPEGGIRDMSVSVDPDAGLTLADLWAELERREDAAWTVAGEERPRSRPRPLQSFARPRETWPDGVTPSNAPWWDDYGRHTLIGAPARLAPNIVGTKLGWPDVLAALWHCYAPDGGVPVAQRGGHTAAPLFADRGTGSQLRQPLPGCPSKIIVDAVRTGSSATEPMIWTPTLACAAAAFLAEGRVVVDRLPEADDFDIITGAGGTALISAHGALLLEHTPGLGFPAAAIRTAVEHAGAVLTRAERLEAALRDAEAAVIQAVRSGRAKHKRTALASVYHVLLDAGRALPAVPGSERDPLVRRIAGAIEKRWGAETRFKTVGEAARTLESMLVSSSEVRTGQLLNSLAVYGFPAAIFGNILGVAFAPLVNPSEGPLIGWGVSWVSVLVYLGLTATVGLGLMLAGEVVRKRWSRALDAPRRSDEAP